MADAQPRTGAELALCHARRRFAELRPDQTVEEALASVRSQPVDAAIVDFYVTDDDRRLHGVVSVCQLLRAAPGTLVASVMAPAAVTVPLTASVTEAATLLARHRRLAAPLVGALGRVYGVIDLTALGAEFGERLSRRGAWTSVAALHGPLVAAAVFAIAVVVCLLVFFQVAAALPDGAG